MKGTSGRGLGFDVKFARTADVRMAILSETLEQLESFTENYSFQETGEEVM